VIQNPRKRSPPPGPPAEKLKTKALTFSARYLGSYPVAESELVPGQCVKVVHSCVKKMTSRRGSRKSSNADKVWCGGVPGGDVCRKWLGRKGRIDGCVIICLLLVMCLPGCNA